jgi:hypothetical protein
MKNSTKGLAQVVKALDLVSFFHRVLPMLLLYIIRIRIPSNSLREFKRIRAGDCDRTLMGPT